MPSSRRQISATAAAFSAVSANVRDASAARSQNSRTALTRQQSLRATLAWSHDLLSDHERLLYRRLGVFAGSFTVEAVEGICSGELDALARLADKSLVHVDAAPSGHRYRMLDTISQHAREQLAASGEQERLEAAHRIWYLGIAEAADRDRDPAVAAAWPADRLEAEHDDLRAALASAIWTDPPTALRLAAALWWFWMARGYFAEASRRLDDVLAAAPEPTPERMRALFAAAGIAVRLRSGSVERVVALGSEALDIARACGDRRTVARALERRGVLAMGAFAFSVADRAFSEALAIGDESIEPAIKQAQGVLAASRGDNAAARALFEDCLARLEDERTPQFWALHISPVVIPTGAGGAPRAFFEDTFVLLRTVGRTAGIGYVLCNIGEAWRADGEFAAAREPLEHALELFRDIGDHQGAGVALNVLGNLARSTGDYDAGGRYFAEALVLRRASGDRREIATTLLGMGTLALYAGDESGRRLIEQAVQIFDRTEDGPGQQLTPLNLAAYELDRGDPRRACELLERVASADDDVLMGGRGWAAAALAEAAIAIDDAARAQSALALALTRFEALGEARGMRYVGELQSRLARMMSGC